MGAITVTNLGKAYKQYPTRWSRLREWLIPGKQQYHSVKWVLQNINFDVSAGEAVGIIGINGAGKSTLLKLITGTTQPTTGSVTMVGRVAALLELGMGFHPDYTGRQNVLMAGQLMGLSTEEIIRLMPEIETFAEIGDYIDQPTRVYSSGMQMRLAFSVATAVRPDILIVDEALSVGDGYFQHKSIERIRSFRRLGTTLLLVSHDKAAILALCDRAMLLSAGRLIMQGSPESVLDYYNALLSTGEASRVKQLVDKSRGVTTMSGGGEVIFTAIELEASGRPAVNSVGVGQRSKLIVKAKCRMDVEDLVVGYAIKDRLGQTVFGTNTYHTGQKIKHLRAGTEIEVSFAYANNLGPGSYSITVALHRGSNHVGGNYDWRDRAIVFEVENFAEHDFIGTAWIPPEVEVRL